MKNYIIALLAVSLAVSVSFIYRANQRPALQHFPISLVDHYDNQDNPLYLLLFFSKQNCKDCLAGIEVLNNLEPQYRVYGIVPDKEMSDLSLLRKTTGAAFELLPANQFNTYYPIYAPTLFGVTQKGRILFILPGIPDQKKALKHFLSVFYNKAYPVLSL